MVVFRYNGSYIRKQVQDISTGFRRKLKLTKEETLKACVQ